MTSEFNDWTVGDSNTTTFDAPAGFVFDLVTQARFWPEWHVASHDVGGVTERPYRVGDVIYEHGRLEDGSEQHLYWHVVDQEYAKSSLIVDRDLGAGLQYLLTEDDGTTTFTRRTLYSPDSPFTPAQRAIVAEASAESVRGLHRHISALLDKEHNSIPPVSA
ncbi:SRPBCC family protein [Nocardia tengchongensis]|uniref:SRPBCC family protein n=1 Tax=Nocardia tengchongensis TaxID=2055889 RepID=A0ABX8CPE8_9NOCA|nr:SRPBCC family protein [Nocardia tengchongensis]QVI20858.1 SRPBCC family protein [Nocardia tengchongensis]